MQLLVVGLLLLCILYPGALAAPYSDSPSSYAVAHESTDAFAAHVGGSPLESAAPTPVSDLDPEAQSVVDRALEAEPVEYEYSPTSGWQRLGSVPVCDDALLVCDAAEEPPSFPVDERNSYETFALIDADGDRYLVRSSESPMLPVESFLELLAKALAFGPYAMLLLGIAGGRVSTTTAQTRTATGYGCALVVFALTYPYLLMGTGLSHSLLFLVPVVVLTWAVLLSVLVTAGIELES